MHRLNGDSGNGRKLLIPLSVNYCLMGAITSTQHFLQLRTLFRGNFGLLFCVSSVILWLSELSEHSRGLYLAQGYAGSTPRPGDPKQRQTFIASLWWSCSGVGCHLLHHTTCTANGSRYSHINLRNYWYTWEFFFLRLQAGQTLMQDRRPKSG